MENGFWHPERMVTGEQPPSRRRICKTCSQQFGKELKIVNRVTSRGNFYSSREWHKLRYEALLKHGRRCMCCGSDHKEGARLHVDHIKPISKYPGLMRDIDNLQILCALCNSGKGSWDETDWRDSVNQNDSELTPEQLSHMNEILN